MGAVVASLQKVKGGEGGGERKGRGRDRAGVVGVLVDEALLQKYGNLWPIDALLRLTQRKCLTNTQG